MEYEDRLTVATPEGVELELALAGLGSRFIAGGIDLTLKLLLIAALAALLLGVDALLAGDTGGGGDDSGSATLGVAIFLVAVFLITFFYDVLFETLGRGRTPGKRWTGLRVVRGEGHPVGVRTSVVRNVVRLVDGPATGYLVGLVSILVTRRHQRLGDLAAGTFVVRERQGVATPSMPAQILHPQDPAAAWDVTGVSAEDLATVRQFLARRGSLTPSARAHLGRELSQRLRPRVGGAATEGDPEAFLERLVAAKGSRG